MGGAFAGALAGLGEGMKSYGAAMQENQKMNWLAKQDEVKFEREKNLQLLRDSTQNKFTSSENQRNRDQQQAQYEGNQDFQTSEREASQKYAAQRFDVEKDAKIELLKTELSLQSSQKISDAKQAWVLTEGLSKVSRDRQVAAIKASPQFAEMSKKAQSKVLFSLEHPEAAQALTAMNKLEKFPTEEYSKAYLKGLDLWATKDDNEKAALMKKAAAHGITEEGDLADFFASNVANQATKLDRLIQEEPESKASTTTGTIVTKPLPVAQALSLAKQGKITADMVDAEAKKGTYTAEEVTQIKAAIVPSTITTSALSGPGRSGRNSGGGNVVSGSISSPFSGLQDARAKNQAYLDSLKK